MPDFTKGKWVYVPPISDDKHMYGITAVDGQNMVAVALVDREQDARLIAEAPDMYRLLNVFCKNSPIDEDGFDDLLMAVFEGRKLIARIDGKEGDNP